jgi:hypothetical protein
MTLASGARIGSRGRRLVTAVPGRSWRIRPAGITTGLRSKDRCTAGRPGAGNTRSSLVPSQEARSWGRAVAFVRCSKRRGGTPRGERAAIRARRTPQGAVVGYASVGVPLPCFFPFVKRGSKYRS